MGLEVGKTHDIVVMVNDTQELGLVVKPHTYRLGRAPEFIPRMGGGEPGAQDFDHWRAFTQRDFHLGEGPDSFDRIQGLQTVARGYGVIAWPSGLGPALLPRSSSMEGLNAIALSCDDEVHIVEMSDAPRALYKQMLLTHTNELWVWTHTNLRGNVRSVVMHSNVMFTARDNTSYQAYGAVFNSGAVVAASHNPAVYYAPAYSTDADLLWNYDGKLWKGDDNKIAYLTPTTGWSTSQEVGIADHKILNTAVAFGRIYFGKADALWCYEGGRVYEVEPFYSETSDDNFKLMHASHGALYFNIRNKMYRYTGAGNIELLFAYPYEALLGPAATAQDKLYFSVRDESVSGSVYAYDFKDRAFWREWDLHSEAARDTVHSVVHVTGLGVAANKLWLAPVESTANVTATSGSEGNLFEDKTSGGWSGNYQRLGLPGTNAVTRLGMRRTCLTTGWLGGLRFMLGWSGGTIPGINLEFCLYADDGGTPGRPTGAPLATAAVAATDVPPPGPYGHWVYGGFSAPYQVAAGTLYHLVIQTAGDATHAFHYTVRAAADTDGAGERYQGAPTSAWSTLNHHIWHQHLPQRGMFFFGSHISELPSRRSDHPPVEYARLHTGYLRMYTPWLDLGYPGLSKFVNSLSVEALLEGDAAQLGVAVAIDGGEGVALESCQQEYSTGNFQDFTAELTDESDGTYMDFEWGTWASDEALFKTAGQYLYICGEEPFDTIAWRLRDSTYHSREFTTPDADITLEVWTGVEWRRVLTTERTTQIGNWVLAQSGQWSWRPARHWESRTFQSATGYWLRIGLASNAATTRENNQRCYEMTLLSRSPEAQSYSDVGKVEQVGESLTEFALEQRATRIAFRFDFIGSREAVAYLKSFKIGYNPVGAAKQEVRFIAMADDNLKILDGTIEHSGEYITEAVQSLSDAGLMYVVALPYPNVHTRNMQVQLGESIMVPVLAYTAQTGKPRLVPYADVSLRLIEG